MVDKKIVKLIDEQSGGKQSGGENLSRYYSKRLKRDKKLTSWPGKDKNGKERPVYSRDCQTSRQPILVSDEELKRINMSSDLGSGRNSYKNSMKYGSDPKNQYNYICPEFWDTKRNISLDPNSDIWDRNMIVNKNDNIKDTDKTILHRTGHMLKVYPLVVKDAGIRNPDLDLPVPCCFNNIIKDVNVETGVITQTGICNKNYCVLNDALNIYLNGKNSKNKDNIFLKKGIRYHGILDSLIYILNIEKILDIDDMLMNSKISNDYIESFFDDINIKNKLYTNDILDYNIVKKNILTYFKIKTSDKTKNIKILKYSLLIQYFEKTKNIVYNDLERNIIRKCIDIEKENFSKDKCIICTFTNKGEERIGVVEKITPIKRKKGELPISYRICCKPKTNYYDKNNNLYSIPYSEALNICEEYDSKEKCKEYDISLDDIKSGIDYYNSILTNIEDIYNNFIYYIKRYIFKESIIDFIKSNNLNKYGNGYIIQKFKKYKTDITINDINEYNSKYTDIDDMYNKFKNNMENLNSFNIYTATKRYINYLKNSTKIDDIYVLPIVVKLLKDSINIIIIESDGKNNMVKKQYYDLLDIDKYILIYKEENNYEPICFKHGKVYNYIFNRKNIELLIDDIQKNISINNLCDGKDLIQKYNITKAYINNNFMTHLITDKNIFIPIQKCFLDIDIEYVYDIKDLSLPTYENIKIFYDNELLKAKYDIDHILVDDDKYTLVFQNNSYIPTSNGNSELNTIGKDLFQLDKQICLEDKKVNKEYIDIENFEIILMNIQEYIGYMLVEFNNKNKRYVDVENISIYKIGEKYKNGTITNILYTDYIKDIGVLYTYDSLLKDINDIIIDKEIDKMEKSKILFDRLKDLSEKNIEKCKNISLIKKEKIMDIFLYRFIELLCIYGVNKNERKSIYNCEQDIELHLLYMTKNEDETFFSYMEDIKEYLDVLFMNEDFIN